MLTDDADSGLDFTAIDFETAGPSRASVCAVAVCRVRDGQVVDEFSTLVHPPTGLESFSPRNIAIHGITPDMVANAPLWEDAFARVAEFIGDDPLVAHNAPFDRSVLEQACIWTDQDWTDNRWFDTLRLSRTMLTLGSYSLPFVSQALALPPFAHHDAGADAEQAALVAVALARRADVRTLDALFEKAQIASFTRAETRREAGDFSVLGRSQPLADHFVAFTGKLTTTTRDEAIALVNHLGGTGQSSVTKKTTMLVTGDLDPRTFRPGAKLSSKLQRAQDLALAGQPIEILTEVDFVDRIDVSREELEQATRAQRAQTRSGWLPSYVVEQARSAAAEATNYNAWIRAALRNPAGRAKAGDTCVRCGDAIGEDTFWLFVERHVCSPDCGQAFKAAAKRAWKQVGVVGPSAPTYAESYGLRVN